MIPLLLKPLALSVLLHATSYHLAHRNGDNSYNVGMDNVIELPKLDFELDINLDLPPEIDDGADGPPLIIELPDA